MKRRDLENEIQQLKGERDEWKGRAYAENARRKSLEREVAALRTQMTQMTSEVLRLARKDPIVVPTPDVGELVERVGKALAEAFGSNTPVLVSAQRNEQPDPMEGLGNMADVGQGRMWVPDAELDPSLEDETLWPTKGGWIGATRAQTPKTNGQPSMMDGYTMTDGGVARQDGQEMFKAGEGRKEPPPGGVE